jgi:uncharacterized damage-inducible protein DinB
MITPAFAQTMAAYNAELNRRVYGAALRLPDGVRREDGGVFWKSIHGTLSHIYWADQMWLSRLGAAQKPKVALKDSATLVDDFDQLWRERQAFDQTLIAWADRLQQADIDGDLAWFSGAIQRDVIKPKGLVITHIFNHQTHHRGQVHALITRFGESTGDTDLPFVL